MFNLVAQKFLQNRQMKAELLRTGDLKLVEGNAWNDSNWGVPLSSSGFGRGQNKLGQILMGLRWWSQNSHRRVMSIAPYVIRTSARPS
jgi:predicted NAD-dependent protein-ADP-ribosyltransferase YbiA (DUF1768 family)